MSNPRANEDRWKLLSRLFGEARSNGSSDAFDVAGFVAALRGAITEACGCMSESVTLYRFTLGYAPEADQSEQVESPHDAVIATPTGWMIGFGLRLERGPDYHPKLIMKWPMEVVYERASRRMEVNSPLFDGQETVTLETRAADIERIAERVFAGVQEILENWVKGAPPPKSIGFV